MLKKAGLIPIAALLIAVALVPLFLDNQFYLQFLISSAISSISVIGFDLIAGNMGYTSFGHSAFMGLGAFTLAILVKKLGVNFWFAMLIAVLLAGVVAYLLSVPSFRLSGIFFSIGTMAFCQIFYLGSYNWTGLTGGAFGISGVQSPFSGLLGKYYFTFVVLFVLVWLLRRALKSPIGSALTAIRENERLGESVGISTVKMKRFAFTVSGMIAGLAGAMSAGLLGFANPNSFTMSVTLEYLVITVVGGAGSLVGPAVAAFALGIFSQLLAHLAELRLAIYGLLLIVVTMFIPGGVYGLIIKGVNRLKTGRGS